MQKKRKKTLIFTLIITAVLLPLLLLAIFFWYLPQHWLNKLQNEYLLQNRHVLRVEKVQAGAFNKIILSEVQLGNSKKPLFEVSRGEIVLETQFTGKLKSVPVKSLILHGGKLQIDYNRSKIYINGILLEKFIGELHELPINSDGTNTSLEIYARVTLGKNAPSADLHLKIKNIDNKLNISGNWQSLTKEKSSGNWQAVIDLHKDELAVSLEKCINEIFMQEILLRAGVPPKATALLNKAEIYGSGSFSGTFKDLQIKELTYSGKVESPEIFFYRHRINNVAPFEIRIQKNGAGVVCRIPQIGLSKKKSVLFKNINISYRKKIRFSAECDFQQLVAESFCRYGNLSVKIKSSSNDLISGSWDTVTDIWSFRKKNNTDLSRAMMMEVAGTAISFTPEKFDFQAGGKGATGTLKQEIKFKELEIYNSDNKKTVQCAGGYFTGRTVFGAQNRPDQHSFGVTCNDFSATSQWGTVELPGFSITMDLQPLAKDKLDLFASFSGAHIQTVAAQNLFTASNWRGVLRLDIDQKNELYRLKTFDFKSDKIKFDHRQKEYEIPDWHIQFNGMMSTGQLRTAAMTLHAGKIISEGVNIENASLALAYNANGKQNERLQGSASCSNGVISVLPYGNISRLHKSEAKFSMDNWRSAPRKLSVKADLLEWQKGDFSGTFQNSKWQVQRKKDNSLVCISDFDFLRLQSKEKKFGNGQFGKSSLSIDLQFSDDKQLNRFNLLGILAQVSWLKGDYHLGSESVQCNLAYNKQHSPLLKGKITMSKANILGHNITASTPELSGHFTAVDHENITGNIDFARGSISDPEGQLELRNAQFTLPLNIGTKLPVQLQSGKFTAQDVFFKQQREGQFAGTIAHFMRLPVSVTDAVNHQVEFAGKLQATKFGNQPVSINSSWQLPPEGNKIRWQFSMPESKLEQPFLLSDYLQLPVSCAALKGNFTLDGIAEFQPGQPPVSRIKLNSINGDWQFGAITAKGLTGSAELNFVNNQYSFMPQDIAISSLLWRDYKLLDNEMNLSLNSAGKLQITNWQGDFLGGKFRSIQMPAVSIEKMNDIPQMKLAVEDMPLTAFFNKFGISSFISDAKLNGDILLNIRQNKLFIDLADLAFKSPAGKLLQLKLKDPSAIKMRDTQFRDFTMAILNAMKCYQANFNFSTAPEAITMKVKAEGTPAAPIPYVYQGRGSRTPFRRAEPGENGFAGEIELNVNLKLHPDTPDA